MEVDVDDDDVEDEDDDGEEEDADDNDDAENDDNDKRWNIVAIYDSRKVAIDNDGGEGTQFLVGWENVGDATYPNTWNWQADIEGFGGAGLLGLYRAFMDLFEAEWSRQWLAEEGHFIRLRDYIHIRLNNVCDDLQRAFPNGKNSTTFSLSNLFNSLIIFFFIPGSLSLSLPRKLRCRTAGGGAPSLRWAERTAAEGPAAPTRLRLREDGRSGRGCPGGAHRRGGAGLARGK